MIEPRLSNLITHVRSAGGRITVARRALLGVLVTTEAHLTAEELAAEVQKTYPDVHLSTVYRTLDALERMGVVDHVHLGHGGAIYHLADSTHHHLVCEVCGVVVEVDEDTLAPLAQHLADAYGFTVRTRHFALVGRCQSCMKDTAFPLGAGSGY